MGNLLYLVHRLPYPPNKGDKVRSYHLLRHLCARHRVYLGTFVDDPEDEPHVDTLRQWCADVHAARLSPLVARVRSLAGLLTGEALTLPYYDNGELREWVDRTCRTQGIDAVLVFSSAMAQYVELGGSLPTLVDFVDADSAKWTQYGETRRWPLSWLYAREGRRLLAFERTVAAGAQRSFFVTENEANLFRRAAPECADRVEAMGNGVDTDFFAPSGDLASPFRRDEHAVVFTGAMDYWPNVDAVAWFAGEVLPKLRQAWPRLRFWIVGRNPAPAVRQLAGEAVEVTGTVADVRPYLMHASLVVAPLRVARGIQNKVLEAMAMARPVLTSTACAGAVDAVVGRDLLAAEAADEYVAAIAGLLDDPAAAAAMGAAGRRRVAERYGWAAHLSCIDRYLPGGAMTERHS